jgi:YfiH family protein
MTFTPTLERISQGDTSFLRDPNAAELGLVVAFSDRTGGVSAAPWNWLNLSDGVGDDEAAVNSNRSRVARALGFDEGSLRVARQVHGRNVLSCDGVSPGVVGEGDALVTSDPGTPLTILTADCVPIVLAGETRVAAVHAGWRGLVAGVIEAAMDEVGDVVAAWVGPCIKGCCYEVGSDVTDGFAAAGLPVQDDSHVDPGDAARSVLARAGVNGVAAADECTFCNDRFFSYRRDGVTGRQGAFVCRVA